MIHASLSLCGGRVSADGLALHGVSVGMSVSDDTRGDDSELQLSTLTLCSSEHNIYADDRRMAPMWSKCSSEQWC